MTEHELRETRKKISKVLFDFRTKKPIIESTLPFEIHTATTDRELADALIAAGLRFGNKHRIFVENAPIPQTCVDDTFYIVPDTPPTITQLYDDEEVEKIVKERDEYKHRAEVAERALRNALNNDTCYFCNEKIHCRCEHRDWGSDECIKSLLQQAEKELAEERK